MQQEDPDQQFSIKDAISFKKDKHRVEIRKKNIQATLKNKRLNNFIMNMQPNVDNGQQNNSIMQDFNNQDPAQEQGNEITLQFYIQTINQECDSNQFLNQSDKISRCLKILNSHLLCTIKTTDLEYQQQQLIQFMRSGGCECILQFFAEKYDQVPLLQAQSIGMIGNIFSLSNCSILSFLIQSGIVSYLIKLLIRVSEFILAEQQLKQTFQDVKNELLSEIFRTIANMAGESYEYRIELSQNGLIRYLTSDLFGKICININKSIVANIVFLIKNMLCSTPSLKEEITEQFIPLVSAFFLSSDLSLESLQDCVLSIRSYAKFGNTIARAKMLSQGGVFEKIHDLINPNINTDFSIVYYAMSTLKDYMKYQNRQAEYVFNIKGEQIFDFLEYYLNGEIKIQNLNKQDQQSAVTDLQMQAIDILHLYVLCDDPLFFSFIYDQGIKLIQLIMKIAIYSANNKINYKAKEFLFTSIQRSTYEQQKQLVSLNILQVILDAIQEDEISLMYKGLRSLVQLLQVAESQIGQSPEYAQINYVKDIMERSYQFRQVIESVQSHPNNDIYELANEILEIYFKN
ncbi:hypothetical protein TTHERM_00300130 (macronuclear) [Tetrahymena thermophila SB210]|uniref:Armadillo-type fold n=1 Tax=Tetrahymena thermophila (strain SB210) TaxID=312017 RepID=I7MM73_TETTS|nr:hypothetical protein TTHERM_00300130 [Tetrahymena thermophila SB210]EAS04295.1 hypothetical protein TTHERM_00300130 [Tetrahymena thermophila SB210]|eukprot:XP_001024540.1 hypothetical protein TTHERM_00300130 [Tetrahymena thermophila SB210]